MKKIKELSLVTALLTIISCSDQEAVKDNNNEAPPVVEVEEIQENQSKIVVDDSARFSQKFLNELRNSGYPERIHFIDDYVVVENDTVYFPNDLQLGKRYEFQASEESKNYSLAVEHINLSTIQFDFELYENGNVLHKQSGQAELTPFFFLASEVDEDDSTGDAYGASEYKTEGKDCWFNIRIGVGKDDEGRLRATINQDCHKETGTALAKGNITLRTKKSTSNTVQAQASAEALP
jgi:hypothetical protein